MADRHIEDRGTSVTYNFNQDSRQEGAVYSSWSDQYRYVQEYPSNMGPGETCWEEGWWTTSLAEGYVTADYTGHENWPRPTAGSLSISKNPAWYMGSGLPYYLYSGSITIRIPHNWDGSTYSPSHQTTWVQWYTGQSIEGKCFVIQAAFWMKCMTLDINSDKISPGGDS